MATRKIVPRADNEGGIGTALKRWASAFIASITCTTINALTFAAAAVGFTIAGGTTSKTLTVDETVAMSDKAPKANPTFTGTVIITDGVYLAFQVKRVNINDETSIALETVFQGGKNGMIFVHETSNAACYGVMVIRGGVNSVAILLDPGSTISLTDTDNKLCFLSDADGTYTMKNRLGYTSNISLMFLGANA